MSTESGDKKIDNAKIYLIGGLVFVGAVVGIVFLMSSKKKGGNSGTSDNAFQFHKDMADKDPVKQRELLGKPKAITIRGETGELVGEEKANARCEKLLQTVKAMTNNAGGDEWRFKVCESTVLAIAELAYSDRQIDRFINTSERNKDRGLEAFKTFQNSIVSIQGIATAAKIAGMSCTSYVIDYAHSEHIDQSWRSKTTTETWSLGPGGVVGSILGGPKISKEKTVTEVFHNDIHDSNTVPIFKCSNQEITESVDLALSESERNAYVVAATAYFDYMKSFPSAAESFGITRAQIERRLKNDEIKYQNS